MYDPATNAWTDRTPIPQAVSHIASATFVMGDRIIVAGGEIGPQRPDPQRLGVHAGDEHVGSR